MTMIISPISGRIVGRRGPRVPLVIAGIAFLVASSMLIELSPSTPMSWLVAAYVVFGIGFGFVNAPITNAAVSGMPREQAGVAAAIATTSRQFGQAIGVAIVGAIVASSSSAHPAWWALTGLGAIVLVLGLVATSSRARESALRLVPA
jgi:predicted MFS family arabinose efflux permease